MTIKLTSLISLMLIVNVVICVEMSYEKFKNLEPCQSQCNNLFKIQKANPSAESPELVACKAGCNLLVELKPTSMECSEKCKLYTSGDSSLNACAKACTNFIDLSKPAIEQPVITEIKNVDDIKQIKDIVPAIQIDPKPIEKIVEAPAKVNDNDDKDDSSSEKENNSSEEKQQPPKKSGSDSSSSSSSSEEDVDKEIESPFEVFRHFFGSSLVGGEPSGVLQVNQDDKKTDDLPDLNNLSENLDQQGNTFDSLFNYFDKFRDSLKSAYDKGSYILRVRIFSNGTVQKTYQELPSLSSSDDSSSLFNNVDSLLPSDKDNLKLAGDDEDNSNRISGSGINWKGIPLAIGKPIIEPYHPDQEQEHQNSMFFRYRECKPIKFHLNSLCHDINNLFTCASMRTGLPRWFFLSAILLTSFLMIWLGLFILSTLRRLRRRERVIQYSEEYLPLYKDIEFEKDGELNEGYEVTAGPLPLKQNIV